MQNISLRAVCPEDAAFICRLMNDPSVLASLHEPSTALSVWEEAIPVWEEDPDEEDRIVLCDGLPVGWIGVNSLLTDMPYVKILIILPEYQGRGAGTAAMGSILAELRSRGYEKAALYTNEDNFPARKCYEKNGFAVVETLTEEMADGSIAGRVRMEANL